MSDINNQICDAISIIVDKRLSQANFDKTIQATIVAQGDKTKGEYKVKYLDSSFYAYDKSGKDYAVGTQVYVLVPENDLSKVKTILGTADKTKDIQPIVPEGNKFEYLTNNLFIIEPVNTEFGIKSWLRSSKEIYNRTEDIINKYTNNATFTIDTDGLSYIEKEGFDYFILKCNVRTNLQKSQQHGGNYGIRVALTADLKENQQNAELESPDSTDNTLTDQKTENIILDFVLDSTMMVGNPYSLVIPTAQIAGFNVSNYKNITITSISLFSENFKDLENNEKDEGNNIFFTDLSLQCANKISADDLNGNYLYISVPEGQYFSEQNEKESITLKAIFQSKGQIIDPAKYSGLTYYWFKKNPQVTVNSNEYCKITGINTVGWECLNPKDENNVFKASGEVYTVTKNSFLSNQQEYRCIALFDNLAYSKTKTIYNLNSEYIISLTSDSGKIFYNNNGEPILTCACQKRENNESILCKYYWYSTNTDGYFASLTDKDSAAFELSSQQQISIRRYPDKVIIDCAVITKNNEDKEIFIGVGTLELLNLKSDTTMPYNLTIDNGSQMFKYNTLGISPIHASRTNSTVEPSQQEKEAYLQPFSFTLLNNKTGEIFKEGTSQKWILPPDNETMFDFSGLEDLQDYNKEGYKVYEGTSLSFTIKSKYDYTKINNTILLEVVKENQTYVARTNTLFVKEGDNGTNGTDYVCQIVGMANNGQRFSFSDNIPFFINGILKYGDTQIFTTLNSGIGYANGLSLIVYKNGELISSNDIADPSVQWSILKQPFIEKVDNENKNNVIIERNSEPYFIEISEKNNNLLFNPQNINLDIQKITSVCVLKAELSFKETKSAQTQTIYASLPIGIIQYENFASPTQHNLSLISNTGFFYAIYSADGVDPQYEHRNFKLNSDIFEDGKSTKYKVDWSVIGTQLDYKPVKIKKDDTTIQIDDEITITPKASYNTNEFNNAVCCRIHDVNGEAIIIIPIHLYLNRFGHAAINGWDGNTVSIDNEGGIVLAPQIGAGFKDGNNAFTGVLMGTSLLKDHDKSTEDKEVYLKETGLMGLHNGERSFFLKSEDGSAVFGKNGSGQIKIIPSNNQAIIEGGKYQELTSTKEGSGMQINLSAPSITYGSKKFSVDKDGILTCTDANINGWFSAKNTYSDDKKYEHYELKFSKTGSSIFMQNGIVTKKDNNEILKSDNDILIKPGYFRVGSSSKLEPEINPENNPNEVYLEDKDTGIEINSESYFKYNNGKVTLKGDFFNSFEDKDNNGKILGSGQVSFSGKNGISMKYQTAKDIEDNSKSFCTFSLNHQGFLFEKRRLPTTEEEEAIINAPADGPVKEEKISTDNEGNIIISGISYTQAGGLKIVGKITATSGTIGGWRITDKYIASQNNGIILYSDGRIIGQYKNRYGDTEIGNDSDFSMMGNKSKVSFTSSGMSTFKYMPPSSSSSGSDQKTYQRIWHEYTKDELETLSPAVRQGDTGYWAWSGLDPYNDINAPNTIYGEPYLITRFQTPDRKWIEIYVRDKISSWVPFSSIGAKKTVIKENEDSTDVDQVAIEAQQPKTPICFSITSAGKMASSIMKFAEPQKKKTPEETTTASTFSSRASTSDKVTSDEAQYAELSFPYSETEDGKEKEYDGTRISAVKIITGDVEIDENAKTQMITHSANSLISAVNEILTPPKQAKYISNGDSGSVQDLIVETYEDGTEYTYELKISNKGTDDEEVQSLKRRKTEIKDKNGKIKVIPEYTINLIGF